MLQSTRQLDNFLSTMSLSKSIELMLSPRDETCSSSSSSSSKTNRIATKKRNYYQRQSAFGGDKHTRTFASGLLFAEQTTIDDDSIESDSEDVCSIEGEFFQMSQINGYFFASHFLS
jgi:hypothetical protein